MEPTTLLAQTTCPAAAGASIDRGWALYRASDLAGATAAFSTAQRRCPDAIGASIGLAYIDLRNNAVASAKRRLDAALAREPENVDALTGRGIAAWRDGDMKLVTTTFERVRALDPDNAEARTYLARLPTAVAAPQRAPVILPDSTEYPARTHGNRFEIRTSSGWEPFYIKGMNLGAALPGKHPSEFPDSATYATWITQIAAMGVNTLRVYTIHPPHFYSALAAYNRAHTTAPLWLIHGVWTELPPRNDFDGAQWKGAFFREMRSVVDVLHGRADITSRPGHTSGSYTADVSPWVLSYIIGREWEPHAIGGFNAISKRTSWRGKYLTMAAGTASDAWMAEASENIIAYEMTTYRAQRPVAYTNWPTLDPLTHPTETTIAQELRIRRARGETGIVTPKEYDNDRYSLDASLVQPTAAFPAGWFASYHAYPYYPDFMIYDAGYARARSSEGTSPYFGYLQALKRHHAGIPVLISEYGVPTGQGIAHIQPQGWNHGGVTEEEMATIDARMTREIAEAGMAGSVLFAWIDEWFKKNWIVIDHEIPLDRTRMWHNRLDAEQHYGMIAMDAAPPVTGATLEARLPSWRRITPLYDGDAKLRAAVDASYVWLLYEPAAGEKPGEILIGFDVLDPRRGDTRWPDRQGDPLPVGLEFVLRAAGDTVRLVADRAANPWDIHRITETQSGPRSSAPITPPLPGFSTGRIEMRLRAAGSVANQDGVYTPLIVTPNRRRFTTDSSEIMAVAYDRGILRPGPPPDGQWERLDGGTLEVRIPWMLLNVTDPSQRRVLDSAGTKQFSLLGTTTVRGIRITARTVSTSGGIRSWPSVTTPEVAELVWPTWETPRWTVRTRSVYDAMKATFAALRPPVLK